MYTTLDMRSDLYIIYDLYRFHYKRAVLVDYVICIAHTRALHKHTRVTRDRARDRLVLRL